MRPQERERLRSQRGKERERERAMEREALFSSLTFDEDAIECIRVEDGFVSLFSAECLCGLYPCHALYGLSQTPRSASSRRKAICRLAATGRSRAFPLVRKLGNLRETSSELSAISIREMSQSVF